MLEDCGLSNMTFESESTCTSRENREKHGVELEKLNQQDNKEQQVHQFRRTIQPKFKAPFSIEMKKSLRIKSQLGSRTIICKRGLNYLVKEIIDTLQTKKKGKSCLVENKLYYKCIIGLFKMLLCKTNTK